MNGSGGSWLSLLKYWTARFSGCDGRLAWLLSEYGKTFSGFAPDLQIDLKRPCIPPPVVKVHKPTKTTVAVTFNTAITNYYIFIVVRSFYHNKVKFDFYMTLLQMTFIWYLILKFYVVLFPSPVGKVRNNKIEN